MALAVMLVALQACSSRGPSPASRQGWTERGIASWYGPGFHGNTTANGERYDQNGVSAAHKTLPFGTIVEVHNLDNGRRLRVRINDRGPFIRGRIIDLSKGAAERLGILGPGTARVEIAVVGKIAPPDHGDGEAASVSVQAGAFRERRHAAELRSRLHIRFPETRVVSSQGWHRVLLGPYARQARAQEVMEELAAMGIAAILRRP